MRVRGKGGERELGKEKDKEEEGVRKGGREEPRRGSRKVGKREEGEREWDSK